MILKAVSSLTVDMKNKHLPHTKDSTVLIPITVASSKLSRREIAQISRWNFLWLKSLNWRRAYEFGKGNLDPSKPATLVHQ